MTKLSLGAVLLTTTLASLGCGGGASSGGGATTAGDETGKAGAPASPFKLKNLNGDGDIDLAALKGKVVIVDFWATWCEPCKKSFPKYQDLYVKYSGKLEIIGVSVDDESAGITDFAKTHGAKFPIGWDEGHAVADKWKPGKMPTAFIVDKEGNVRFTHEGYHDGEEAEIETEIKSLF